jgi:hypothetical protein
VQLWSNDGSNTWSAAGQLKLDLQPAGLIVADLFLVDSSNPNRLRADRKSADGDGPDDPSAAGHHTMLDLVAFGPEGVRIVRIDGRASASPESRLQLADGETGLEEVGEVTAAVAGDLEADGDLDFALATKSSGVRLFANHGDRTFFEVTSPENCFAVDDPVSGMAIADLDRDLDLDIVTVHAGSGRVGILENLLHLQFRGRYLDEVPAVEGASAIAVEDVDGNASWDLIVGGTDTAIVFSQTAGANAWTVDRVETNDHAAPRFLLADLDNNSWIDFVTVGPYATKLSSLGPWGFGAWKYVETVQATALSVAEDFDRSGSIDLVGVGGEQAQVFANSTKSLGQHVDVRFDGIDDNASGRVNHFAIGSVLELRFGPHYRARIVKSPSTHFGLDGFDGASSVRAILPNGLTQTIRDPKIDSCFMH